MVENVLLIHNICKINKNTHVLYWEATYRYNYIIDDDYEIMQCGIPNNYKCKNGDEGSSEHCESGVCFPVVLVVVYALRKIKPKMQQWKKFLRFKYSFLKVTY